MNRGGDVGQVEERTHKLVIPFENVVCKGKVKGQIGTAFRGPPNAGI